MIAFTTGCVMRTIFGFCVAAILAVEACILGMHHRNACGSKYGQAKGEEDMMKFKLHDASWWIG